MGLSRCRKLTGDTTPAHNRTCLGVLQSCPPFIASQTSANPWSVPAAGRALLR